MTKWCERQDCLRRHYLYYFEARLQGFNERYERLPRLKGIAFYVIEENGFQVVKGFLRFNMPIVHKNKHVNYFLAMAPIMGSVTDALRTPFVKYHKQKLQGIYGFPELEGSLEIGFFPRLINLLN